MPTTRSKNKKKHEQAAGSTRQKKKENEDCCLDCSDDPSEFESYEEEIGEDDELQVVKDSPTELFSESNVDGKKICPISSSMNTKKNAMFKAAKKLSKSKENLKKVDNRKNNDDFNKENEKGKCVFGENEQTRMTRSRTRAKNFHLQPDKYFSVQSEKSVTSNNTLSKLKNKQLDEKKLRELLQESNHASKYYQETIKTNYNSLKFRYCEWVQIMDEGFNVLLYGLGSKRSLINDFYKETISEEPTLIINGFFPSLTIKEILDNIITELLGLKTVPSQSECVDIIKKTMDSHCNDRIYLLIHNIDGEMLRLRKVQETLSCLANIPNVHLLASIDHINSPLIWDNVMRARFNFYWVEATTFLPYQAETSYESSLLIQKSGALALLSMKNVFVSLTRQAKEVFVILIKYQLEYGRKNYSGMTFKDLFDKCREGFISTTDQALRSQLTEFIDHKLVKIKRNLDGAESLVIPMDNNLLKQFLEQYNESL